MILFCMCFLSEQWPAEVQAIGSILTLFATGALLCVTWRYTEITRRLVDLHTKDREDAQQVRAVLTVEVTQPSLSSMPMEAGPNVPRVMLSASNVGQAAFLLEQCEVRAANEKRVAKIGQIVPASQGISIDISEQLNKLLIALVDNDFTKLNFERDDVLFSVTARSSTGVTSIENRFRVKVIGKLGAMSVFLHPVN